MNRRSITIDFADVPLCHVDIPHEAAMHPDMRTVVNAFRRIRLKHHVLGVLTFVVRHPWGYRDSLVIEMKMKAPDRDRNEVHVIDLSQTIDLPWEEIRRLAVMSDLVEYLGHYLHRVLSDMLIHELDEMLLIDGERRRDPHR